MRRSPAHPAVSPLLPLAAQLALGLDFLQALDKASVLWPPAPLSFVTLPVNVPYSYLSLKTSLPHNTLVLFSSISSCAFMSPLLQEALADLHFTPLPLDLGV